MMRAIMQQRKTYVRPTLKHLGTMRAVTRKSSPVVLDNNKWPTENRPKF